MEETRTEKMGFDLNSVKNADAGKESVNKKKWIIGTIIVVTFIIIISAFGEDDSSYYECIVEDEESLSGAVFDYSFSNLKSLVGRELSIGDLNSSSGGWNKLSAFDDGTEEYNIVSTTEIWAVNVGVCSSGNVSNVTCKTVGLDNGEPSDFEIESFASVFAEITGGTEDSVEDILKDLYTSGNKVRNYDKGILWTYEETSGLCNFGITSMSEEYWESIQ